MKQRKMKVAVSALAAVGCMSTSAMAFENEFHGMYKVYGYMSNALSGGSGFQLREKSGTDKYIEQRARLQYIAKASDDLKLVTHFEIDTKFGGTSSTKYPTGDAGGLDADRITLETKNVYLDFKIPYTPIRAQVGIQPYSMAIQGLYGNFDASGAVLQGNFGALKATYGYFTVGNNNTSFAYNATPAALTTGTTFDSNSGTQDLNILDLKFAVNKDINVGTSYYMLLDKVGSRTLVNNTVDLNADVKFGPAALSANVAFQFGKENKNLTFSNNGTTALAAELNAKVAVGQGKINLAALYLSGDKNNTGHNHAWQPLGTAVTFYTPANMWLLTRHVATINTSTAIGGSSDITRGGRGILGFFGGYEGTAGKVFYNGNVGHAKVDRVQNAGASSTIGTELNATIGYKLYNNMSASFTGAYAFLGDGYGKSTGVVLTGGVNKADNPFMGRIALDYTF